MRLKSSVISMALAALALTGCDSLIYDYEKDCREGLELNFVYDYNMEMVDAFSTKVHCLTVLVYDSEGNLLERRTERTDALSRPGYTMTFDLPKGTYHVAAYGGMDCDDAAFVFDNPPESLKSTERTVSLASQVHSDEGGILSEALLHDHFFGMTDVEVADPDFEYTKATVEMVKNTNHFRVILQQVDGMPLDSSLFKMNIVDDNLRFAHDNSLIPTEGGVTYGTWSKGHSSIGTTEEGGEWMVVHGELSTSRLVKRAGARSADTPVGESSVQSPRLVISNADSGDKILDISLLNYLLLLKSDRYANMADQEFLDRQSEWNMIFFLDKNLAWIRTHIVVNDWVVRINDANL